MSLNFDRKRGSSFTCVGREPQPQTSFRESINFQAVSTGKSTKKTKRKTGHNVQSYSDNIPAALTQVSLQS